MTHNQKKGKQPGIIWRYSGKKGAPRILGINPWIYDFAAYNVWTRPVGLLCCLEMLGRAGADTALVDFMDRELDPDHWPNPRKTGQGHYPKTALPRPYALKTVPRQFSRYGADTKRVREVLSSICPEPDLILVTSLMTYWYPGVISCIRLLKEIFPRIPVILGGIYATLCHEHALNSGADLVISGPLERSDNWRKLWNLLGQDQVSIPENSGIKPDTSFYARPDFSIIMTSRGCPFKCPYCASSKLYPRFRQADPESVIEHVRQEYERGVRDFSFYDDALLINPESVLYPLLEYIIDNDLVLRLHAPNALHIRYLTPRTCRLLKKAGLETIRLGLETTDFSNRL
ncbi:MAG: cobalamin-dependent protein, partial [Desulfovibrionales bacterium]|nr:cobalamin-dependent protein [Desulfovibrionales bacterium]